MLYLAIFMVYGGEYLRRLSETLSPESVGGIVAFGMAVGIQICRVLFWPHFKRVELGAEKQARTIDAWETRFKMSEESYAVQFRIWNDRLEHCEKREEDTRVKLEIARKEIEACRDREYSLRQEVVACQEREKVLTAALAEARRRIKDLETQLLGSVSLTEKLHEPSKGD